MPCDEMRCDAGGTDTMQGGTTVSGSPTTTHSVKPVKRLVQDQNLWVRCQSLSNQQPPVFAGAQREVTTAQELVNFERLGKLRRRS